MKAYLTDKNTTREALQSCVDTARDEVEELEDERVRLQQARKDLESQVLRIAHETSQADAQLKAANERLSRFTAVLQRLDEQ